MLAVVKEGPAPGIAIREIPTPRPGPGEVLVKVLAVGICGSDVHIYNGHAGFEWMTYPHVPGHEFCGEVVEAGEGVDESHTGRRVVVYPFIPCYKCAVCKRGLLQLCDWGEKPLPGPSRAMQYGLRRNGGMAEYVDVPILNLFDLPSNVSDQVGGMMECFVVGYRGVRQLKFRPGCRVIIIGPGPVGLSAGISCLTLGAGKVTICGLKRDELRLNVARQYGMQTLIIAEPAKSREFLYDAVGECDLFIEAAGSASMVEVAAELLVRGGDLLVVGITGAAASLPLLSLVRKELHVHGVYGNVPGDWHEVLELFEAGRLNLDPFITGDFPLTEADKAFKAINEGTMIKAILRPGEK